MKPEGTISSLLGQLDIYTIVLAIIIAVAGYFIAKLLSAGLGRTFSKRLTKRQSHILQRITFYIILLIFIMMALQELGFKMTVLLGATGVFTLAIGFAAQTSISNIVSGLFLMIDKPYKIGDSIQLKNVSGEVHSVDLLSTKIRTFDNTLVRVPNETLLKADIVNYSRLPTRRVDVQLRVSEKADLRNVEKILLNLAKNNDLCLDEPEAVVVFSGFGDIGINFRFSLWAKRKDYSALKSVIVKEIKQAFSKNNIEIPYVQVPIRKKR